MDISGLRAMHVNGIMLDPEQKNPLVILVDDTDKHCLPIAIGQLEASSIAVALQGLTLPRPLTHDLMKTMLDNMQARLVGVVITDLLENRFHARLEIETRDGRLDLDTRPSDGIALALRARAPTFVAEHIPLSTLVIRENAAEKQKLREYVDSLKPSDFRG